MSWLVHLPFTRCLSAREASYVTTRAIWRSVRIKTRSGRKLDGVTGEQRKNYVGSHAIRKWGQWKEVTETGQTCSRRLKNPFWSVTYTKTSALGKGSDVNDWTMLKRILILKNTTIWTQLCSPCTYIEQFQLLWYRWLTSVPERQVFHCSKILMLELIIILLVVLAFLPLRISDLFMEILTLLIVLNNWGNSFC